MVNEEGPSDKQGRRVQIVLLPDDLRRLLGLPGNVRVVSVHVELGRPATHVVMEGEGLPELAAWIPGGLPSRSSAALAFEGLVEPPVVWHPIQGDRAGRATQLRWGSWRLGDEQPAAATWGDVDESAGQGDVVGFVGGEGGASA